MGVREPASMPMKRGLISAILTLLVFVVPANSQETVTTDSIGRGKELNVTEYLERKLEREPENVLEKTEEFINTYLDEKDSIYISPNLYNFTIMPQYSNAYEYYRFSTGNGQQRITMSPSSINRIGLYLGWRWLFLGYSIDLEEGSPQTDINFSFYTSKAGIDLFYRKRTEGYRIRNLEGFKEGGREIVDYNHSFDGLTVEQMGLNLYYVFNNKKFSYPAAYSQSTNQRISAGSFILGVNYNEQSFAFDHTKFDPKIQEALLPELKFNKIKYKDFSINFGYSYNWVFAKDCLANISVTPAVGYKNTSFKLKNGSEFFSNINFDLITRAAIVYNNGKYYAGASLVSHTYSYNKNSLAILNGFGVINVYVGFNFWRRK